MLIVAVADGHGDKKHALSHIGSQLAVTTAVELMEIALRDVIVQSHKNTFQIQKELQLQLPKRIHYEWKKRVLEEISKDRTEDSTEFLIEEILQNGSQELKSLIDSESKSFKNNLYDVVSFKEFEDALPPTNNSFIIDAFIFF